MKKALQEQFLRSEKMNDFEYIREFEKISVSNCFKVNNVNISNI